MISDLDIVLYLIKSISTDSEKEILSNSSISGIKLEFLKMTSFKGNSMQANDLSFGFLL